MVSRRPPARRPVRGRRPRVLAGVVAALAALAALAGLAAPAAATTRASAPRVLVRDVQVDSEGQVVVLAAVSADVTEAEVLAGLRVRENGVAIDDFDARFVAREELDEAGPATEVALLLDTSGSTADDDALGAAQAAASAFVRRVVARGVPITLVAFDDDTRVLVRRSTDAEALVAAITALVPGGETALYDAVDRAVEVLDESGAEQRRMVLFTDGGDTASAGVAEDPQRALEAVAGRTAAAGIELTAVSLQTGESDQAALATLAAATGGVVLPVADAGQLGEALGDVARSIASQLRVTYASPNPLAAELQVVLSLDLDRGVFTSPPRTVDNPLASLPGGGVDPGPPQAVAPPDPLLTGGPFARWLGMLSAAASVGLLGLLAGGAPRRRRRSQLLRGQLAPPRRAAAEQRAPDEASMRERLLAVLEAVPRPKGYDERIQDQLERAAWPLRTSEYVGMRLGLAVAGLLVGWALSASGGGATNPVLLLLFAGMGWMGPWLVLQQRRQKRSQAFHAQMADTLQMLAGSLRAGYGLMQGMDNVAHEGPAPTNAEFGRAITEIRLGVSVEDALAAMAERVGSEDFRWVTVAISIQRKVGGNLAELLDTVAATLREREGVRRQVQVLSAEGRLSAIVLIALPIGFALYLAVSQPSYFAPLLTSTVGLVLVGAAVVLMALGAVWIRRVVRIEV